ncbi:MAG: anhydro-N-acetylmuramic acid kinase [Sporocytophaga sp.]|uniref:anhydro-N-acetylmuramic acid kinase n=1 Tax=Sporocytophaga sp. TaxID=2231183 RepID=UPI001B027B47|nr:anhydro-N-acetylmuramic acid kinase [Sporocytophaga sp.]MBO9701511.1 anhydro-N-acetylmuramic acid kinase [Sporocytophaga sp.]
MKNTYIVAGLMSGTSLDGLDIAVCKFELRENKWSYEILEATTFEYDEARRNSLKNVMKGSAESLAKLDFDFGYFQGNAVKNFLDKLNIPVDFISTHGHTIFHQPENRFTTQIGNGAAVAAASNLPVVCDFRSLDVALRGQGAPLVPIGDKLLFKEFDFCLNLGGIANISYDDNSGKRIAFDICPANMVLNLLAAHKGHLFDHGGALAKAGVTNKKLLEALSHINYYSQPIPKSLGKEHVDNLFIPLIENTKDSIENLLNTFCHHIAEKVTDIIKKNEISDNSKVLITGGGAFNEFLVGLFQEKSGNGIEFIVPEAKIVSFKEALIFAFLGTLRWRNEVNSLSSVTGSMKDNCGGAIYLAP